MHAKGSSSSELLMEMPDCCIAPATLESAFMLNTNEHFPLDASGPGPGTLM